MPFLIPHKYLFIHFLQDVSKLSLFCVFEPNTSSDHEDACQNIDQSQAQESAHSSAVSPVCDSVCSDTKLNRGSALYPKISSVCSFLKTEPDPMEMNEISAFNGVPDPDHHAVPELKEITGKMGFVWHKGLQTPLKECSVKLVDCGKTLKQVTKRADASKKCEILTLFSIRLLWFSD